MQRDIEEALTIFDRLTEENQRIALERLWEIANDICKEEEQAV